MAKAPVKGIAARFCGTKNGPKAVLESLLVQQLVSGQQVAEALRKNGEVICFQRGDTITEQGAADNDIYFLLSGSVNVLVNGYVVATRQPGTHFGEMAAMDYTAKRSATITAEDDVVVLRVAQDRFAQVANRHSTIWKELARVLGARLRERSKFFRSRNARPIVFIGSSFEGQMIANEIKAACERKMKGAIEVRLWCDGVFQASRTVIEDLLSMASDCDFAVLVLTPDDKTTSRGKVKAAPRDNVIYELGLFTGALGRERALVVVPSAVDIKIPTDLLGVTTLRYKAAKTPAAIKKRVDSVAADIVTRIQERGLR